MGFECVDGARNGGGVLIGGAKHAIRPAAFFLTCQVASARRTPPSPSDTPGHVPFAWSRTLCHVRPAGSHPSSLRTSRHMLTAPHPASKKFVSSQHHTGNSGQHILSLPLRAHKRPATLERLRIYHCPCWEAAMQSGEHGMQRHGQSMVKAVPAARRPAGMPQRLSACSSSSWATWWAPPQSRRQPASRAVAG